MRPFILLASICCFFSVRSLTQQVPLRVVSYNLLNFPDGRTDCGTANINLPNRVDTLRKVMQYLKPDILGACEIQTETSCDSILSRALNVFGSNHYQRALWSPNNSGDIHNMLFFNSDKLALKEQRAISTSVRKIDHYILYVLDPTLPQHHDTIFVEVFMCHLKAGSAAADQNERAVQTAALRAVLASRPTNRHMIVCGDLNTYRSSEVCYQNLIASGAGQMKDPINTPGNWTSNSSFAGVHTQSPRSSGSWACGATGGLDDRFDHILLSQNAITGSLCQYQVGTYKAIGNDGAHYNQSILTGGNSQYPDSVVRAIFYLSDHLPVKLNLLALIPSQFGLNLTYTLQAASCATEGAEVSVIPLAGQGPFTYQWDAAAGGQTTQTVTGIQAGSYCVTVTDALGNVDQLCMEIPAFNVLQVSAFYNNATLGCDGSAFVAISGGQTPYNVQWNDSNNSTTESVTDLCPGTYTCTITDASGCVLQEVIQIGSNTNVLFETEMLDFMLFPNPNQGIVTLKINRLDNFQTQVTILSTEGKTVLEFPVSFQEGKAVLEMGQLTHGTYLLQLGVQVKRVVLN
jgi:hypothetical protein